MVRAVTPSCSSLSLLRQVSERVQRLLCAPWLEGVGSAGEELPLLQLHPLQERRAREAQQRLPQGVYSFFLGFHTNTNCLKRLLPCGVPIVTRYFLR